MKSYVEQSVETCKERELNFKLITDEILVGIIIYAKERTLVEL